MEKKQTSYEKVLGQVSRRMKKAQQALLMTQKSAEAKQMDISFSMAFDLAHEVEKMALLTRVLPAYTGHPQARAMAEEMIKDAVPVKIGFTREGWFSAVIPALLPKKEGGGVNYYRGILYPAMDRFFAWKPRVRYPYCTVIFRHIYNRERPERQYRDHDNIELNAVTDIIAFFTMKDDHPLSCEHHYCSAAGGEDRTEVYVVPRTEFIEWFTLEKNFPDEGVELLENRP